MTPPSARTERGGVLAMVAATLIWGGTFVVLRDAVPHVRPVSLVFARFLIATLVLAAPLAFRGRRPSRATVLGAALSGVCTTGEFLFQAMGLTSTSAGSSAFLTCIGGPLAAFFAWPLLRERPDRVLLTGLAAALAGAAILTLRQGLVLGPGELWTLLAATLFAFHIVVLARVAPRADALEVAAIQTATVTLLLLPWATGAPREIARLGAADLLRLAYLAIPATVIAPWLQIRAQQALPAGRIGLLFVLEPLFALVFALTVGAERFPARWWLGAVLIVIGVVRVEGRTLAPSRREDRPASARAGA